MAPRRGRWPGGLRATHSPPLLSPPASSASRPVALEKAAASSGTLAGEVPPSLRGCMSHEVMAFSTPWQASTLKMETPVGSKPSTPTSLCQSVVLSSWWQKAGLSGSGASARDATCIRGVPSGAAAEGSAIVPGDTSGTRCWGRQSSDAECLSACWLRVQLRKHTRPQGIPVIESPLLGSWMRPCTQHP